MNYKTLLQKIEAELKSTHEEKETTPQLARLEHILREYEGPDRVITSRELVERIKKRPEVTKYLTGFRELDAILDGFREKQVVVIAAPTKSGKTSFCIELTTHLGVHNPLWFPLEEPAEELIRKFIERELPPPHFVTPETITKVSLEWLEERIIEAVVKYDSKIVFIDHLHFIVPFHSERMDQQIGRVMRELKRIAKQLSVVIVLIAHLKKTRLDNPPDLEDLRDSSFIAQEADTVLILWRQSERKNGMVEISNNVNVSVQANRWTGRTGNVQFVFANGRFLEKAWEEKAWETRGKQYEFF